jgi:hypothetical protein
LAITIFVIAVAAAVIILIGPQCLEPPVVVEVLQNLL